MSQGKQQGQSNAGQGNKQNELGMFKNQLGVVSLEGSDLQEYGQMRRRGFRTRGGLTGRDKELGFIRSLT